MNITQTVPDFLGGISQQSDFEKAPGLVQDAINVYPDITYGLQKRAGTRFEFDIGESDELLGGRWFAIAVESEQPYFGVVLPSVPTIRVWNSATGVEQTVTGDFSYIAVNDRDPFAVTKDDIKVTTINQANVITNRKCEVDADTTQTPGTLTDTVTTVAELPTTATTGDIVYITNGTSPLDDYYVSWDGTAWVETVEPGIDVGIDNSTMPHALVQTDTGFAFVEVNYTDRQVGNEDTNPHPSFVGSYIENAFFYLNRVGFLSQNNVILSQPLKPNNDDGLQSPDFYRISTLTQSPADPVDLNASSVRPVVLRSMQPAYQGLVLFADGEQFMMYSDSGVITPQTALVKSISTYELHGPVDAIEMGDEYFYISRSVRHTRVMKMVTQGLERGPILTDISKIINDYLPNTIDNLVPNSQNQALALSASTDNKMYFYKMYQEDGEVLFRSWYTWEFPGLVQTCAFIGDRMFQVTSQGGRMCLSSLPLNLISEEEILTNIPISPGNFNAVRSIGPYLDFWIGEERFTIDDYESSRTNSDGETYVTNPIITFEADYPNNISTWNSDDKVWVGLQPLAIQTRDELSRLNQNPDAGALYLVEPGDNSNQWVIQGTFKDTEIGKFVVGYRYAYDVHLPTYYYAGEGGYDFNAFLTINRYKFLFREAGPVGFKIQYYGRNDMNDVDDNWHDIKPVTPANYYKGNTVPLTQSKEFMIPIHQRNTSFKMRIYSDSPFPVTLSKLMWEGNYNSRYYRRA